MSDRDELGALTVAGLRECLANVPDDALVLVHPEDGSVFGLSDAYDDGPGCCFEDDRHVFRLMALDDENTS